MIKGEVRKKFERIDTILNRYKVESDELGNILFELESFIIENIYKKEKY